VVAGDFWQMPHPDRSGTPAADRGRYADFRRRVAAEPVGAECSFAFFMVFVRMAAPASKQTSTRRASPGASIMRTSPGSGGKPDMTDKV